jgi:hypothetical protein
VIAEAALAFIAELAPFLPRRIGYPMLAVMIIMLALALYCATR